jgi:hypothetical protein
VSWIELATVVVTFLTALVVFFQTRKNTTKLQEVHLAVNGRLDQLLDRVTQLTAALTAGGVKVPPAAGRGEAGERLATGETPAG